MSDDYRTTEPAEPEKSRKKSLRTPGETMRLAADVYPDFVVHSEHHATQNAARSAVKRIQAGKGAWGEYPKRAARATPNADGKTWDVSVGFTFD